MSAGPKSPAATPPVCGACPSNFLVTAAGNTHVFHVYAILSRRARRPAGIPRRRWCWERSSIIRNRFTSKKSMPIWGFELVDFPVAEQISRQILPLPIYPELDRRPGGLRCRPHPPKTRLGVLNLPAHGKPGAHKTQSLRRHSGLHRLHALAAFLVERPLRQLAAGPGIRLGHQLVLQTGLHRQPDPGLLAHQHPGLCPHAKGRRENHQRGGPALFPEMSAAGTWRSLFFTPS